MTESNEPNDDESPPRREPARAVRPPENAPRAIGPLSGFRDTEFEDEPPGGYLREFAAGPKLVWWAGLNAVVAFACALFFGLGGDELVPAARVPFEVLWILVPASAGGVILILVWLQLSRHTLKAPRPSVVALGLSVLALLTRWLLAWVTAP